MSAAQHQVADPPAFDEVLVSIIIPLITIRAVLVNELPVAQKRAGQLSGKLPTEWSFRFAHVPRFVVCKGRGKATGKDPATVGFN